MKEKFLDGKDSQFFDYSYRSPKLFSSVLTIPSRKVDDDPNLDDLEQREKDEQDKYFGEEDQEETFGKSEK
jgi:hypothetical protein